MPARVASSSRRSPGVRRMPWKTGRPTSAGLVWARRARRKRPSSVSPPVGEGGHGVKDYSSRRDCLLAVGGPVTPPNSTVSQADAAPGRVRSVLDRFERSQERPVGPRPSGRTTVTVPATPELVVVIGAGSMGQAIARRIGVGKTILLADLNEKAAAAAADTLQGAGFTTSTATVDVASHDSVHDLAATASDLGAVTDVVHTAGLSQAQA